jgi:alpha-mannosidase
VRLVGRRVDLLETDPTFGVFMLDGQTVILEDYLEVRPQQEKRLLELARQGRISVGPWYVLPGELLVSPESIIRNLALGHGMGERYGGALKAAYVPDGFGHIAQLPQILRGFGIDSAFFWRGMGDEELGTEFECLAPDGSAVTAIFMPWGCTTTSPTWASPSAGVTRRRCVLTKG